MRWTKRKHTFTLPGWTWFIIGFAAITFFVSVLVVAFMKYFG